MRLTADDHRKFADVGFLVLDAARPLAVKAGGASTFHPMRSAGRRMRLPVPEV